ncbi:GSCFA domain-containing protein [Sediminicoccus sp. BL-A-41-H5]|uniref:GSCFA domain-containing protein n=1 Tax=Sediminicoccus sp. BL-A-41-H5 TaxID=3421106 RepID=UPI003D675A60
MSSSPTDMASPYAGLESRAYWRTGVATQDPRTITGLYRRKFPIARTDNIVTAGSCFAQHVSRQLKQRGCAILDAEPPPAGLSGEAAHRFGYDLYSGRYGNVYTVRQLLQLLREVRGRFQPEGWIWERDGRFYDALRPSVEPDGLASREEVMAHRASHLARLRWLFGRGDLLVFTMGLTEAWQHRASGTIFPTAPGTIAGSFDPAEYEFVNFSYQEVYADFLLVRKILKARRKEMRFLLTVSPVPLTATASGDHVLAATLYSKSVLRAVAGRLAQELEDVDYFPSYDLIGSHFSKGAFYDRNLRSVTNEGVQSAMRMFFSEHVFEDAPAVPAAAPAVAAPVSAALDADEEADDVVCEEMLLEAFAR